MTLHKYLEILEHFPHLWKLWFGDATKEDLLAQGIGRPLSSSPEEELRRNWKLLENTLQHELLAEEYPPVKRLTELGSQFSKAYTLEQVRSLITQIAEAAAELESNLTSPEEE